MEPSDPDAELVRRVLAGVTGRVVSDSREVEPGDVFVAVTGAAFDGCDFVDEAVAAGAVAVVAERPLAAPVPVHVVRDARAALGPLAAAAWGHPSRHMDVVGITGTNGKTTTAHLLAAVLASAGRRAEVMGTLTGVRTTPEAPDLQARLARWRRDGVDSVAMEVSSHALAQGRVAGTWFAVGVFTNLSQDHLDYHGDMETYYRAKASLFEPGRVGTAVVNRDDAHGRRLLTEIAVPGESFGLDDAVDLEITLAGARFRWGGHDVRLPLVGRHNVANALAAATAARTIGVTEADVAAGLSTARPAAGRFEPVDVGQPFAVVVDYAHTPEGLDQVLRTIRELVEEGRTILVFGCGGDRDREKRPMMGAVALAGADVVVLTSDNPRSEDPAQIAADVLAGVDDPEAVVVDLDRRSAIRRALGAARPGDGVVIAGKGHETTQTIGPDVRPFDDREVAAEELGLWNAS